MDPLAIKDIERQLTAACALLAAVRQGLELARLRRSHLAALIYTLTAAANPEACDILLAQVQKLAEQDQTVDKLLDSLYDRLAHPQQVDAQD